MRALLADGDVDGLAAAGALPDGELHPALAAARRAASGALATMRLERGGREGAAWAASDGAAIAVPRPDGRWQLSAMPVLYLPEALGAARTTSDRGRGSSPRCRSRCRRVSLRSALAAREYDAEPALAATLAGLREHWRIESRWEPRRARPGCACSR